MNTQKETKKRLGALDILIILVLAVCIVSIGWRYFSTKGEKNNSALPQENYIVSFDIYNIQEASAANFLEVGTEFFLSDDNSAFGVLRERISTLEAERFYTTDKGEVIRVANTGTGDQYRVDFKGTMTCKGMMDENGSFLLNGTKYLAINKEIKMHSKYLSVIIKITGITPDVAAN